MAYRYKRLKSKTKRKRTLFYSKPKHPGLAREISIRTKKDFVASVKKQTSKKSYSTTHYRALLLAKNRAKAMLKRKDLKPHTRRELQAIAKVKIPKPKK